MAPVGCNWRRRRVNVRLPALFENSDPLYALAFPGLSKRRPACQNLSVQVRPLPALNPTQISCELPSFAPPRITLPLDETYIASFPARICVAPVKPACSGKVAEPLPSASTV